MGHEDQFAPPRLSGRSAFREETFAGRRGKEKDAALPAVRGEDRSAQVAHNRHSRWR